MASLPDPAPDPSEEAWTAYRQGALRRALEQLPPPKRQALGLTFFEQLSHGEIASVLELPLGTAKSRIRSGLRTLRLAPALAILAGIAILGAFAVRLSSVHAALTKDERALAMLTSGDARALRLTVPGLADSRMHGVYRFRAGSPIEVITLSHFPAGPLRLGGHRLAIEVKRG